MRQVCGLLPLTAPCRAFVTSLLAPGALQPAGSTSDALEAIIRLARGIPVRIWPPVRDRLGTGCSDASQTTAILADTLACSGI
jgi:hypothetical protein